MTAPQQALDSARVRLTIVAVVVVCLFGALFARLWYLQVIWAPQASAAAQSNGERLIYEQAPRGRILDRNGQVLADNRITETVTISRDTARHNPAVVQRLAALLGLTVTDVQKKVNDQRFSPYVPVPLAIDVDMSKIVYVREHQSDFPGVDAKPMAERSYPNGPLAANVLGYIGQISDKQLAARKKAGYQAGDQIGQSGVEAAYESTLRGQPGVTRLQVNAKGRVLGAVGYQAPVQGHDLWLSIDLNVQKLAEDSLAKGLASARQHSDPKIGGGLFKAPAGSAIVLDPRDGSVLAMATNPTYNPNDFVNGISTDKYNGYLNDPSHPLNDRTIQGQYAPGSTFKMITAIAGLSTSVINTNTYFDDTGGLKVGQTYFKNDNGQSYGYVNLPQAITVSSDAYFYKVGADLWNGRGRFGVDALQNVARQFGFGAPTGIPLPNEAVGRVPDQASRAKEHAQYPQLFPEGGWFTGDNVNTAVGQGEVAVTPLQLANAYATFANGGTLWTPRIVEKITEQGGKVIEQTQSTPKGHVTIDPQWRSSMLTGFEGVTTESAGTARGAFIGFPTNQHPVAGKTGTAQVTGKQATSVFTSFAPADNPTYVVDAFLEEAGYGAESAAPVVRRIYDGLFGLTPTGAVTTTGGVD